MPEAAVKNAGKPVRVAVVEDERELRESLRGLLDFTPDFVCAGSFGTMEDALRRIETASVDLILTDIGLPLDRTGSAF